MYLTKDEFKELAYNVNRNYEYRYRFQGFLPSAELDKACLLSVRWLNRQLDNLFSDLYFNGSWRGMEDLDEVYDYLITSGRLTYPITTGSNKDFELEWEEF